MNVISHILLATAAVMILLKSESSEDYIASLAGVSLPLTFSSPANLLIGKGLLPGSMTWIGDITGSFVFLLLLTGFFHYFGYWRPGLTGYLAYLVPEFFLGGVKLLLPFRTDLYGFNLNSFVWSASIMLMSSIVVIHHIRRDDFGIEGFGFFLEK
ncbi:MAG: hypothetical protein ABEK04_01290 [Candidatus Nanohalobium sp.]